MRMRLTIVGVMASVVGWAAAVAFSQAGRRERLVGAKDTVG